MPFYGNEEFGRISPLRRIPVLIDGTVELCDSTVICECLEERYPSPPLLPPAPEMRARTRWIEEFADIAVASFFRNARFAGFTVDADRWPATVAFVARTLDHPSFAKLRPFEETVLQTPIPSHREALAAMQAPLTEKTFASPSPRRGILRT